MEITYLGTAAAEGIPGIYCGCETCRRAIAAGGRNIMTRSQDIKKNLCQLLIFAGIRIITYKMTHQSFRH